MNLQKLITESVLYENIKDIKEELTSIQLSLTEQLIIEGVDDPGILKCVFMAGGPGSGKSFTAMEIFGIDKTLVSSFSTFGLKSVNSDSAFESLLKKNGIDPKKLADIEKENPELWDKLTKEPGSLRGKAKILSKKQQEFYEAGRLGLIIDGTGHNYSKIQKQKQHAEALGYDTYMVFVNCSLEVALERNKNRDRILPEELVQTSWKEVQENLGKFQNLFGGHFRIVDNTVYKPISRPVQKAVNQFINVPIQNHVGKQWIKTARELKNRNLIKK
jgi:predicted kinase